MTRTARRIHRRRTRWLRRAGGGRRPYTGFLRGVVPPGHRWVPYTAHDRPSAHLIGRALQRGDYHAARALVLEGCRADND